MNITVSFDIEIPETDLSIVLDEAQVAAVHCAQRLEYDEAREDDVVESVVVGLPSDLV